MIDVMTTLKSHGRPLAKRLFGSRYKADLWLRWAYTRVKAYGGFRPIFRGIRIEYYMPGHAWAVPFDIAGPAPNEVLIRTIISVVSPGTERAFYSLEPNAVSAFPSYPGYSLAGEVWQVGKRVQGLHPGQLVATQAPHASVAVVPEDTVFTLPKNVSPEEGAFFALGIIALGGIWRGQLSLGERAAVLGRGIIGQLVVQLLHALGAGEVVSIAPSNQHHPASLEHFAQQVIATTESSNGVLEAVKADVTYEASGNASAIQDAVRSTRDGGRVVLLGSPRGITPNFDFGELADRSITLLGAHNSNLSQEQNSTSHNYRQAGETFLRLVAEKTLDIRSLINIQVNPWEAGRFYRHLAQRQSNWVGALMHWDYMQKTDRLRKVFYWTPPDLEHVRGMMMSQVALHKSRATTDQPTPIVKTDVHSKSKTTSSHPTLRLAIIGCGERGIANAVAAKQTNHATLAMVMDVNETLACRLGEQLSVPWTTDYTTVLNSDHVDAVFINTPHNLHEEQAVKATLAGKHIILEKPLAHNLQGATHIVRAAHEAGVQLSVWLGSRYLPQIAGSKKLVEAGALGNILGAHLTHHLYKPIHYWQRGYTGTGTGDWRSYWKSAGGGVFLFNAIHHLDWILYLTEMRVTEVSARYATFESPTEVEDSIVVWLTLDNGALVTVNATSCVPGLRQTLTECRLWGHEGHLSLTPPYQFYSSRMINGRRPERWHYLRPLPKLRSMEIEYLDRFAQAVLRGERPEIMGEDGLHLQEIMEAAYRSSREGHPVHVEYTEL